MRFDLLLAVAKETSSFDLVKYHSRTPWLKDGLGKKQNFLFKFDKLHLTVEDQ